MLVAEIDIERLNQVELEFGGVRFETYYTRYFGTSTRLFGRVDGEWVEMLRFDDFVDVPHYHAPADDDNAIMVNVAETGEPMAFFLDIIETKLSDRLPAIGFGEVLPSIDQDRVRANLELVRYAMNSVLPEGFSRVPGQCLQDADEERGQTRKETFAKAMADMAAEKAAAQAAAQPA
jgi:hypothetical protein